MIDYHVNSQLARQAIFTAPVAKLLQICFEEAINAFQCLTFNYGSQQAMHQDGAYVVVSKPLQFMASWIALEDVSPGSGELQYHVGSHKLDDFLFPGNSKSWNPAQHGKEIHQQYIQTLKDLKDRKEMPLATFLPKKGDALIWASDLVHGGSRIQGKRTRRSIVTHYCPLSVKPNFRKFSGHYYEARERDNCYYTSRHYDLKPGVMRRLLGSLVKRSGYRKPAFMGGNQEAV
jgi:ectoine hydroxylase-related dioxygenase (phytanoyl-CoA dioxygenase family)